MTNSNKNSFPHRIDFFPLAGLPDLSVASRRLGEIMQKEASPTIDGGQESPGFLHLTELVHDETLISSPAWRGVRWMDEGENEEALDSISESLIQEFPSLCFMLTNRRTGQTGDRLIARAHFRWPGAMGPEETIGLEVFLTAKPMMRKNQEGKLEWITEGQAELEKILGGCLVQVPQAAGYFRSRQDAQQMDKVLPEPGEEQPGPQRAPRI